MLPPERTTRDASPPPEHASPTPFLTRTASPTPFLPHCLRLQGYVTCCLYKYHLAYINNITDLIYY